MISGVGFKCVRRSKLGNIYPKLPTQNFAKHLQRYHHAYLPAHVPGICAWHTIVLWMTSVDTCFKDWPVDESINLLNVLLSHSEQNSLFQTYLQYCSIGKLFVAFRYHPWQLTAFARFHTNIQSLVVIPISYWFNWLTRDSYPFLLIPLTGELRYMYIWLFFFYMQKQRP